MESNEHRGGVLPSVEIRGSNGIRMELSHTGSEYLLTVEKIPFEDKSRGGSISQKTETYDLKTNDIDVANKILNTLAGTLTKLARGDGSLVGYFRENFVDELKDISAELQA